MTDDRNCLNCLHCIATHPLSAVEIQAVRWLKRPNADLPHLLRDSSTRKAMNKLLDKDLTELVGMRVCCLREKWYVVSKGRVAHKPDYILKAGRPTWTVRQASQCQFFDDGGE